MSSQIKASVHLSSRLPWFMVIDGQSMKVQLKRKCCFPCNSNRLTRYTVASWLRSASRLDMPAMFETDVSGLEYKEPIATSTCRKLPSKPQNTPLYGRLSQSERIPSEIQRSSISFNSILDARTACRPSMKPGCPISLGQIRYIPSCLNASRRMFRGFKHYSAWTGTVSGSLSEINFQQRVSQSTWTAYKIRAAKRDKVM